MIKLALKAFFILLIFVGGLLIIGNSKVVAFALNPNPRPAGIPSGNATALENCNYMPYSYSPAFQPWLSDQSAWASQTITVPYGTTSVGLTNHWASSICSTPVIVPESRARTTNATVVSGGGSVSGAIGQTLVLANGSNVGDYRRAAYNFTYNTEPITSSKTIVIRFTHVGINYITDGRAHTCIGGDERPNLGGWFYNLCTPQNYELTIRVNVQQQPIGNVDSADCNTINGWAFDGSNVSKNLELHAYFEDGQGFAFKPGQYTIVERPDVDAAYPGVGTNKGFAIPVPNRYKDGAVHSVNVYAIGINSAGEPNGQNVFIGTKTFGPCYDVSCSVSYPAVVEPGETFSATFTVTNNSPVALTAGLGNWRLGANSNGFGPGNKTSNYIAAVTNTWARVDFGGNLAANGGTRTVTINNFRAVRPGGGTSERNTGNGFQLSGAAWPGGEQLDFQWQMVRENDAWYGSACGSTIRVASKPYFKVFGNDVSAGSDFSPGNTSVCNVASATNNKAAILSFARETPAAGGNPPNSRGAGTQLANFALGEIWQNISGANQGPPGTTASSPPKGLTFGNYYSTPSTYGGQGGQYRCIPDYYTLASTRIGGTPSIGSTLSGSNNLGDRFIRPATGRLLLTWSNLTSKSAVVVDGDVFIGPGGITYAGYSGPANMPSLYLIVRGDIRIAPGVTNLSGVFIAQPKVDADGNPTNEGGNIYTCANADSFVAPGSLLNGSPNCSSPLTVNGAFIARNIRFSRTAGTLGSSVQNETWGSSNIAEVFKSSPELYMGIPEVLERSSSSGRYYDSITSLPPIL